MEDKNLLVLKAIQDRIKRDPCVEKAVSECNDIAKRRASEAICDFTMASYEMVKLVNEACISVLKEFDTVDVRTAMELGIWAQETLLNLYGEDALKNLTIEQ